MWDNCKYFNFTLHFCLTIRPLGFGYIFPAGDLLSPFFCIRLFKTRDSTVSLACTSCILLKERILRICMNYRRGHKALSKLFWIRKCFQVPIHFMVGVMAFCSKQYFSIGQVSKSGRATVPVYTHKPDLRFKIMLSDRTNFWNNAENLLREISVTI